MAELNIPLVEASELKTGRGGGKRGGQRKYEAALASHIDWIKEKIENSKDGYIRVKTGDLAQSMGMKLKTARDGPGLHETSIYWGVRDAIWEDGIIVETGKLKDNSPVLKMRFRRPEDILPDSLAKKRGNGSEGEETDVPEDTDVPENADVPEDAEEDVKTEATE